MDFDSARKQFERLTRLLQSGELSSEEFTEGVDKLAITDEQGNDWMIGMQSGQWYRREGGTWVEDDPHGSTTTTEPVGKSGRSKRPLVIFLVLALVLACAGIWYFGLGGVLPFQNGVVQQTKDSKVLTQVALLEAQASQTLAVAEGTNAGEGAVSSTPAESHTPTLSGEQLTATAITPTPTIQPSATATPLPPEPAAPPEAWESLSAIDLEKDLSLKQDWAKALDKNWEYEFLTYEDQRALLVQFMQTETLFHADGEELGDVERQTTLAIPDIEGEVEIVCRWDEADKSGYALRLSNQTWQLLVADNGSETVLVNGNQSPEFREGDYETFRMRCQGDQLVVTRNAVEIANMVDDTYETGAAGLRFNINVGIGLAFFTDDRIWAQLPEDVVAGVGDVVRLANLDIQLVQLNDDYDEMEEGNYEGEDLIGLELRVDNFSGEPIQVQAETFSLTDGQVTLDALNFLPSSAGDRTLIPFVFGEEVTTGEVFFSGVSPEDLEDWLFVIDLRYQGFGEAVFTFEPQ
ncbi:MAG: hypothetical protein P8046_09160 [Anaerolineales bacterium]